MRSFSSGLTRMRIESVRAMEPMVLPGLGNVNEPEHRGVFTAWPAVSAVGRGEERDLGSRAGVACQQAV
jgi:hypothetical protein